MPFYRAGVPTLQKLAERCREMVARATTPRNRTQLMLPAADGETKVGETERQRRGAAARRQEAERQEDYQDRRE